MYKEICAYADIPPSKRPLQQDMILYSMPAFCAVQSVIYGAASISKQAKPNSPPESLQMNSKFTTMSHT